MDKSGTVVVPPAEPSTREGPGRPIRSTRGKRVRQLSAEERKADDSFWAQSMFQDDDTDEDYQQEEDEEDAEDAEDAGADKLAKRVEGGEEEGRKGEGEAGGSGDAQRQVEDGPGEGVAKGSSQQVLEEGKGEVRVEKSGSTMKKGDKSVKGGGVADPKRQKKPRK